MYRADNVERFTNRTGLKYNNSPKYGKHKQSRKIGNDDQKTPDLNHRVYSIPHHIAKLHKYRQF